MATFPATAAVVKAKKGNKLQLQAEREARYDLKHGNDNIEEATLESIYKLDAVQRTGTTDEEESS